MVQELEFWFLQLIDVAIQAIKQTGEMLFRMLFNMGEFGKVMKDILKACCLFIDFWLMIWNYTGCQVIAPKPLLRSSRL